MPQATTDTDTALSSKGVVGREGVPELAELTAAEHRAVDELVEPLGSERESFPGASLYPVLAAGRASSMLPGRGAELPPAVGGAPEPSGHRASPMATPFTRHSDPYAVGPYASAPGARPYDADARATRLGAATGGCMAGGLLGMVVGGPVGALVGGVMGGVAGGALAPRR